MSILPLLGGPHTLLGVSTSDHSLLRLLNQSKSKTMSKEGVNRNSLSAAAADPDVATGRKVVIKSADMKPEIQKEAIDIAISAFEKCNVEKDVAEDIKKQFDNKFGPTWHCIVGKNFGSYVTHETNHFVYFYLDSKAVLLFKSG